MKKLTEDIERIKKLAGIKEGDVVPFGPKKAEDDDAMAVARRANDMEDQLNAHLPNLGADKRLMADFNEQYGTIEIWIETDEVTTMLDIQTLQKAVNMVHEAHFIGVQPMSGGIKLIFSMR